MLNKASHGLALNSIKSPILIAPVVFLSAFLFTAIFAHFSTPARDTSATIDPATYYVNLTTNGNRSLTVNASPSANIGGVTQNLTISTNSPSGYKLYISTNSNNATAGNRLNLNGSLSATSAIAPTSGTFSTPATLDTNSWGYSLASGNFNHNGVLTDPANLFAAIPKKGGEQLVRSTSSANPSGDNLVIYYGVKVNNTLPAGDYSNTVVYTALTEASSVSGGEAAISPTTINAGGGPVTITTSLKALNSINTFTIADLGTINTTIGGTTCTSPSYSLDSGTLKISCTAPVKPTGSSYNIQVSIPKFSLTYNITNGITYNAPSLFTINNMQEMTPEICNSVATPSNTATTIVTSAGAYTNPSTQVPERTLTDTRDNKTYKVRKLADGNCWMSENLRLGGTSTIALNSTNSNLPDGVTFTLPVAETNTNHTNWGVGSATAANTPHVYNTENNSYGNYYNWYTAVAGTANFNTTNSNAPGSICPKGWYLPGKERNAESDYYKLLITIYGLSQSINGSGSGGSNNVAKMFSTPLSLVLGGYKYSDTVIDQGNKGSYWSRVASSTKSIAFALLFNLNGALLPHSSDNYNNQVYKTSGNAVRCISNPTSPSAP